MRPTKWLIVAGLVLSAACGSGAGADDMNTSSSTTTTPDTTTTTEARREASVGVVGCSMTLNALEGYHRAGGVELWPRAGLSYGRGSVARWIDPELGFWDTFLSALDQHAQTDSVWWQLCTSGSEADDLDHALRLLQQIEEATSGASILVSPQPDYTGDHVCQSAGPEGPARMADLADELVATGRVARGPELSPLSPDQLADSCHANEAGMNQMGSEVLDFFES